MKLIEWINGITKLNKKTMDEFQNNINNAISNIPTGSPIGSGYDYYGLTEPNNYMWADGREISRTDYAELFEVFGGENSPYGLGDGSTTFNLPDKRERVSVMYKEGSENGTEGATLGTLGAKGGEFTHTQTVEELAEHTHIQNQHRHSASIMQATYIAGSTDVMRSATQSSKSDGGSAQYTAYETATNQNTGESSPMNIMQSYLVCNYIIKVK